MASTSTQTDKNYDQRFNELKKSISSFTELDTEKPLGEKIKELLGDTYDQFLDEEINSMSNDFRNVTLKNLVNDNLVDFKKSDTFQGYYDNFVKKTKEDLDFDFDTFENLLFSYSKKLIDISNEIKSVENDIDEHFSKLSSIKEWVSNIPEDITVDKDSIYDDIMVFIENNDIKEKLKLFKQLKLKYFFLRQYFFINPFISLAEEDDLESNDSEPTYQNDLEEIISFEPKESKGFFGSFLSYFN